jgi:hypothetical protein
MRRRHFRNRIAEPREQSRSRQDLGRQRFGCRIQAGKKRQALARMRHRNPGKQAEMIANNFLGHRLTDDKDDPRPRHLQKHQHAQHTFFVMVCPCHSRHISWLRLRLGTITTCVAHADPGKPCETGLAGATAGRGRSQVRLPTQAPVRRWMRRLAHVWPSPKVFAVRTRIESIARLVTTPKPMLHWGANHPLPGGQQAG